MPSERRGQGERTGFARRFGGEGGRAKRRVFIHLRGEKMFILKTREMVDLSVRKSTHENRFRSKMVC